VKVECSTLFRGWLTSSYLTDDVYVHGYRCVLCINLKNINFLGLTPEFSFVITDEVNAIVIDFGESTVKAGYSGEGTPRALFPSVYSWKRNKMSCKYRSNLYVACTGASNLSDQYN
jgi:Actin